MRDYSQCIAPEHSQTFTIISLKHFIALVNHASVEENYNIWMFHPYCDEKHSISHGLQSIYRIILTMATRPGPFQRGNETTVWPTTCLASSNIWLKTKILKALAKSNALTPTQYLKIFVQCWKIYAEVQIMQRRESYVLHAMFIVNCIEYKSTYLKT